MAIPFLPGVIIGVLEVIQVIGECWAVVVKPLL